MAVVSNITWQNLIFVEQLTGLSNGDNISAQAIDNSDFEMGMSVYMYVTDRTAGDVTLRLQDAADDGSGAPDAATWLDLAANKIVHPQGASVAVDAAGVTDTNLSETVALDTAVLTTLVGLGVFSNRRWLRAVVVGASAFDGEVNLLAIRGAEYPPV